MRVRYLIFLFPLIFIASAFFAFRNYQYRAIDTEKEPLPSGVRASYFDWANGKVVYVRDTPMVVEPRERANIDTIKYNELNAIEEINQR